MSDFTGHEWEEGAEDDGCCGWTCGRHITDHGYSRSSLEGRTLVETPDSLGPEHEHRVPDHRAGRLPDWCGHTAEIARLRDSISRALDQIGTDPEPFGASDLPEVSNAIIILSAALAGDNQLGVIKG